MSFIAYKSSTEGFKIGETTISIISGSGAVSDRDVVTFAGNTNNYVVKIGADIPGNIVLENPGLKESLGCYPTAMKCDNN